MRRFHGFFDGKTENAHPIDEIKRQFKKQYKSLEEENYRKNIFLTNYKNILVHNMNESSYQQGVNHFSDLTEEEFENGFLTDFEDI